MPICGGLVLVSNQIVVSKLVVDFAERDEGIVVFAHAETIYVMKNLKWGIAIWVGTFSIGLGCCLAFLLDGDVARYFAWS